RRWSLAREHESALLRVERCAETQAHLIGLPPHHRRVDRLHERIHPIEPLGSRARREPLEIVVGARDVAVRAGGDVDDDPSVRVYGHFDVTLSYDFAFDPSKSPIRATRAGDGGAILGQPSRPRVTLERTRT